MLVSIIIITFNRKNLLCQCINSLLNQTYKGKKEIIIIDDGSADGTKNVIEKLQKKSRLIKYFYQGNKGFAIARNKGMSKAVGDIIIFTDDDCIPKRDWIEQIVKNHIKYPDYAAIGGSIAVSSNSKLVWANHLLNFSAWLPVGNTRFMKDIPTTNISYKKKYVQSMSFDESLEKLGYEDSLFNSSLVKKGHKLLFNPSICVCHNKEIKDYVAFLGLQRRYGYSFLKKGYKVHGIIGKTLIKFKLINLLCPRLVFIAFRTFKSLRYTLKFFQTLPLIIRGEFEKGLVITGYKRFNHKIKT